MATWNNYNEIHYNGRVYDKELYAKACDELYEKYYKSSVFYQPKAIKRIITDNDPYGEEVCDDI